MTDTSWKRIKIYVEGPTDKAGLEALLSDLIVSAMNCQVEIKIIHPNSGDRQKELIFNYPAKALSILRNNPHEVVFIIPDLYPMNRFGQHYNTPEELHALIKNQVKIDDSRIKNRLHIHCFVHEFEAILMASDIPHKESYPKYNWAEPEKQNGKFPPKQIITQLYPEYDGPSDAPALLKKYGSIEMISKKCPYFSNFIDDLKSVIDKDLT
jgi:hypothetical protein